ncbi:unnamed protein product [Cylicocyclus nassatus]|uniref:Uncharacterized protein n=1 Tax=Cylicocyclus nassatus TaxID=53992 RepID=A0AA36DK63_CYLNA|nr:unnamed protein product [Cylicocyclus nassatus]
MADLMESIEQLGELDEYFDQSIVQDWWITSSTEKTRICQYSSIPTPGSLPVQIEVIASELNVRPEEMPLPAPVFPYAPYLQQRPGLMPSLAKYYRGTGSALDDERASDSASYDDQFEKDLESFPWPTQLFGKIIRQRKYK